MRRETALGNSDHGRQVELMKKIVLRGDTLVKVATSGFPMSDEIKARILSTLLTLMNCRESMDRAAMRQSALRRFGWLAGPPNQTHRFQCPVVAPEFPTIPRNENRRCRQPFRHQRMRA